MRLVAWQQSDDDGDRWWSVIYPVVVIVVDGIKCKALLNTSAGSSYESAALVRRLNKRPIRIEHRQIEMILCSTTQKAHKYEVKVKRGWKV